MIANDQPLRAQMIKRMLDNLIKNIDHIELTEWERDFISSIQSQFDKRGDLSTKQTEILERIYDK